MLQNNGLRRICTVFPFIPVIPLLGAGEVFLMADASPTSFDARYFGPVSRGQILNVVVPLLTW